MNTKEVKVTELNPIDSHKSFYGKAKVITVKFGTRELHYLQSYETIVAVYDGNEIIRLWNGWSATTGRHIVSFCSFCGVPAVNKKEWDKLPVESGWRTDDLLLPFNWKGVNTHYGLPAWAW